MREKLWHIIFGVDTRMGKWFDIIILYAIIGSVLAVMLESVTSIRIKYGALLYAIEWGFTILFSIEYILRVYSARDRWKYITSFYGIIDLLSTIPSYAGLFNLGKQQFIFLRAFRLLRIFRIFKISRYIAGSDHLVGGLKASKNRIVVFMIAVFIVVIIVGSLMYIIEDKSSGFTSIPRSIYWAIVTITTVGYGDISPESELGQILASMLMLIGYAIIAVPSGIVTASVINYSKEKPLSADPEVQSICSRCGEITDKPTANYCFKCGQKLHE